MKKAFFRLLLLTLIVLVCTSFIFFSSSTTALADTESPLVIEYFYNNPCASCDEEGVFLKEFNLILGNSKSIVPIDLRMYNAFHTANYNRLASLMDDYKVSNEDKNKESFLFFGSTYLAGKENIADHLLEAFLLETEAWEENNRTGSVNDGDQGSPTENSTDGWLFDLTDALETDSVLFYFYVSPCSDCDAARAYFDTLEPNYLVESLIVNLVTTWMRYFLAISRRSIGFRYRISLESHWILVVQLTSFALY